MTLLTYFETLFLISMEIVKKIVLSGHFGVGKSSLVKRFIQQKFSDQYLTTIGVKVDKKVLDVEGVQVKLMIWDIAGESNTMKIPKKYLTGAHGVLYVFDLSREETYVNIQHDLFEINKTLRDVPSVVLGNKSDLVEHDFIENLKRDLSIDFSPTSAKTGDYVEESFLRLAKELI
ncbi:MAG: Rab family GTPase [Bacteroidota bacterium]